MFAHSYFHIVHLNLSIDPSQPTIAVSNQTPTSLTFLITSGKGSVDSYIISINGKKYNVNATINSDETTITVPDLDPGDTYENITVIAVFKGLRSVQSNAVSHSTSEFYDYLLSLF